MKKNVKTKYIKVNKSSSHDVLDPSSTLCVWSDNQTRTHKQKYTYTHTHIQTHPPKHMHIHTHTHPHRHTHTPTHTPTHTTQGLSRFASFLILTSFTPGMYASSISMGSDPSPEKRRWRRPATGPLPGRIHTPRHPDGIIVILPRRLHPLIN